VVWCKQCADRSPVRAPTRLGEAALVRDEGGSVRVRTREVRAARRHVASRFQRQRQRPQPAIDDGMSAVFRCYACRSTLEIARDRLQAAVAGRVTSVLVAPDGELVLMYF
jgi:hypothetical protein